LSDWAYNYPQARAARFRETRGFGLPNVLFCFQTGLSSAKSQVTNQSSDEPAASSPIPHSASWFAELDSLRLLSWPI